MNLEIKKEYFVIFKQALFYLLAPAIFLVPYNLVLEIYPNNFLDVSAIHFITQLLLLTFVILVFFKGKNEAVRLLFQKKINIKNMFLVTLIGVFSRLPILIVFFFIFLIFGDAPLNWFEEGVKMQWEPLTYSINQNFFVYVFSTVILVPIQEELFFRGVVFNKLLKNHSLKKSVIISSLIFAIFHFHYGLYVGTFILGILLSFVYYKFGNIWYAIYLHMLINLQPFIFNYLSVL